VKPDPSSKNRDGGYEGGSPVDTTRANTSPETLARQDAERKGESGRDQEPGRDRKKES
jgi:hypothetical protein